MTPGPEERILRAAREVLSPPVHTTAERAMTVLHGSFLGRPARVACGRPSEDATGPNDVTVRVSVELPVRGVVLWVTPRPASTIDLGAAPRAAPEPLDWVPAFRERFQVGGAPLSVLRHWLDPAAQNELLQSEATVACDGGRLDLYPPQHTASEPATLRTVLQVAAKLAARLPDAITAAGAGAYLPAGTLASHPDVVSYRSDGRRRMLKATCLGLVVLALLCALVAAIVLLVRALG